MTAIKIDLVLAAIAVIETSFVVIVLIVHGSDLIPLPRMVRGLTMAE